MSVHPPTKKELKELYAITPIKLSNNCYAFVMGTIGTENMELCDKKNICKKPQPGYISGIEHWTPENFNTKEIMRRVIEDSNGKIYVPNALWKKDYKIGKEVIYQKTEPCADGYYKGALVIAPDYDYHFYRQMEDGTWMHKRGQTEVSDKDASGRVIMNPQLADRDYGIASNGTHRNYSQFCTYFCIPYENFDFGVSSTIKTNDKSREYKEKLDAYILEQLKKIESQSLQHIKSFQQGGKKKLIRKSKKR